jgi:hypothetical protein
MKYLRLIALLAVLQTAFLPARSTQPPPSPQDNHGTRNQVSSADMQKTKRLGEPPSVTGTRDWIDKGSFFIAVFLAIIGAMGVWAAFRILRAINRQAEIMVRQTEAMINSERAWLVAELRPHVYQGKDECWYHQNGVPLTTEETLAGKHLLYSLKLTNMGRTPAQIVGFEVRYACLPKGITDLPKDGGAEYAEIREFHHLLGAEGSSVEIDDPVIDTRLRMKDSWDAIRRLEKTAVIHGSVRYRHMFSAKDDSYADFCYVYTVSLNRLRTVGPHTRQR